MNKTNYIILSIVLCFSLALFSNYLNVFACECGSHTVQTKHCFLFICWYTSTEVCDKCIEEIDNVCSPPNPDPVWKYSCSACGDYPSTMYTCYHWTYPSPCSQDCSNNSDCGGGGGGGGGGGTPYVPPTSPPPTSPPPTSPPPTCQIFKFTINGKTNEDQNPLIVWVKALLKGYFSVNDVCKTCTVTSNVNWNGTYPISTSNSSITESFKINTAGTYSYTLECVGADPEDIAIDALSLQTVQALNLPWWREIIPNLGGFLRGL